MLDTLRSYIDKQKVISQSITCRNSIFQFIINKITQIKAKLEDNLNQTLGGLESALNENLESKKKLDLTKETKAEIISSATNTQQSNPTDLTRNKKKSSTVAKRTSNNNTDAMKDISNSDLYSLKEQTVLTKDKTRFSQSQKEVIE